MTLNLVKPGAVVSTAYARWMPYGPNGSGKSSLAATMPGPIMVMATRGENLAPYAERDAKQGDVIINIIDHWDQVDDTYHMLKGPQGKQVKTVVFDTLTRVMMAYFNKITGVKMAPEDIIAFLKTPPARKTVTFDTWRDLGEQTVRTAILFNELPMHVVYLCQEETRPPKFDHDILETYPMLSPFGWKGIKDVMHLIGRLYATEDGVNILTDDNGRGINPNRKDKRMMLIGQHDRYTTKGDTQTLGYVVENPSWDNLSKALKQ